MRSVLISVLSGVILSMSGCQSTSRLSQEHASPGPPEPKVIPHRLEQHGTVRTDNYYWLRERDNPEVIAYLEAENAYTERMMDHLDGLEDKLFAEITGRIKQTDMSAPYKLDDYFYYTRYEEGKGYPLYCRKLRSLNNPEQIMLDVNEMAKGHGYCNVGRRAVSPGQDILAYSLDTVGRRIYTIHFKNLESGEILEDKLAHVTGNMAWANDNRTLFYARQDPITLRSSRIYRHVLGTDPSADTLVYEEQDDTFSTYVTKTKTKKYLLIASFQTISSEYRFLEADDPEGAFRVFHPRRKNHEYRLDHFGDHFYVRTNDQAKNFRLIRTPVDRTPRRYWEEVIPHREDVLLQDFEIMRDHLVLVERQKGLIELRIRPWNGGDEHHLDFGEPVYRAYPTDNHDIDNPILRYAYSSLTTPDSTFDYNMETRARTLVKQEQVLGGFDKNNYRTQRRFATARDGTEIPISIVCRKETPLDGNSPLLLYGYGSYGASMDASFSSPRLSLIDRGFIFAIAHVRGGQELGRGWYEDGKLLNKMNTFTDFIDCAEYLIQEQYTRPGQLFAMGGSAGGLLMGAIMNMRPELFKGVVAAVPFVDVVTTMLDETIPLTTSEYDEWGDPRKKEYFEYILSYSPYDNIRNQNYPHLLVTTGLHDSQVQYWEPAKWVAKLRAHNTGDNCILLRTYMEAGHGGVSGRYKRYREIAFQYAFLLDLAGVARDS